MIVFLLLVLLFAALGVAGFQVALLTQCGLIQKRLGLRFVDEDNNGNVQDKLNEILGENLGLPSDSISIFASLSCTQCSSILRSLPSFLDEIEDYFHIYLADKATSSQVKESLKRYPEYKFEALPGEQLFQRIGVQSIPLMIKTDQSSKVIFASIISDPAELERFAKRKG